MQTISVCSTTLFHLAARYLGDATQWDQIANLNAIEDPWLAGVTTIVLPQAASTPYSGTS
jgi:hypothetical protein